MNLGQGEAAHEVGLRAAPPNGSTTTLTSRPACSKALWIVTTRRGPCSRRARSLRPVDLDGETPHEAPLPVEPSGENIAVAALQIDGHLEGADAALVGVQVERSAG